MSVTYYRGIRKLPYTLATLKKEKRKTKCWRSSVCQDGEEQLRETKQNHKRTKKKYYQQLKIFLNVHQSIDVLDTESKLYLFSSYRTFPLFFLFITCFYFPLWKFNRLHLFVSFNNQYNRYLFRKQERTFPVLIYTKITIPRRSNFTISLS